MPRRHDRRPSRRTLVRALTRHRRVVAAGLLAGAVMLSVSAVRPSPPVTTDVLVATRDLPAGAVLTAADVERRGWAAGQVPAGALTAPGQALGAHTSGRIRAGEPITDVRLATSGGLAAAAAADHVALPVRLADASVGSLLEPGAVVDVIAADGQGSARVVAEAAEVIDVDTAEPPGDSFAGVLVVLSVPPGTATQLAAAAAVGPLSVALRS